jgi:LysM repeat protein
MAGLDLGKQIGPLPLGAWVVVVAGGLGIAYYTRHSGANTAEPDTTVDTSGDPGVGDGTVGGWTSTTPTTGTGSTDPRAAVVDNDTWAVYVEGVLIGRYNYDPLLVDSAVRKYISGVSLSVTEYTIIRQALTIMVPPNPLPADGTVTPPVITPPTNVPGPVKTPPKPAPKPTPKPKPAARYYTVKKGDNLWNISKKYYGTGTKYMTIFNANHKGKKLPDGTAGKISNPALIQPGWRLVIP